MLNVMLKIQLLNWLIARCQNADCDLTALLFMTDAFMRLIFLVIRKNVFIVS